ncbi:MAG TPA: Gfo/Idh/MocA family oxidoreductase [Candidatus Limnocylindrales bacterium]|nr:Gfo/Idh/MocA family oxidoreductase [Candidatus Limnocylindrales bacterium]
MRPSDEEGRTLDAATTTTGRRLRWGILGPGRIAPRIVRALHGNPRGELVAVAGRDLARATAFAERHGGVAVQPTFEALLDDPSIDVVYIALPNSLHARWTVAALDAGKHVLCEKPLAMTVEEVDAVIAATERNRRLAVEAFMYLHHPQTARALELVRTGALGDVQVVNAAFSFFLTHPGDPRVDPELGGGSLWDVGCYPVSVSRRIAGEEPTAVSAYARFDERGVDRTLVGQLRFPSGLLAHFESGFGAPDRERVEIVGSEATLVVHSPFLPAPDGPEPRLTILRDGREEPVEVASIDAYRAEVDDLQAAILDGTRPRVDLAFSRGGIATLVALDRAARAADPILATAGG